MDIKPDNIFVRNCCWYLGDFGSCVEFNQPVREFTACFLDVNRHEQIAEPRDDFFMLGATLLVVSLRPTHPDIISQLASSTFALPYFCPLMSHEAALKAVLDISDLTLRAFIMSLLQRTHP
jgi:serine/threonine protein kinase